MKKLLSEEIKVNKKQINTILSQEASKSNKIKQLFDLGLEVKEIANLLEIRYNFAYNVLSNYINLNDIEVTNSKKSNKKDEIIELFLQQKTNKEIAKITQTNYNYVLKVIKEYKSNTEKDIKDEAKQASSFITNYMVPI